MSALDAKDSSLDAGVADGAGDSVTGSPEAAPSDAGDAFLADTSSDSREADAPLTLGTRHAVYKVVATGPLYLYVFSPPDLDPTRRHPGLVLFFGGAWATGTAAQFSFQAMRLAAQGTVVVLPDYRVQSRQGTTPFEAVEDARSAMRWVRAHAGDLGIDPRRLAAGGGSAGGHLALGTALFTGIDDPKDDLTVSPRPDALVLFNPVCDTGPQGFGNATIGPRWREISPVDRLVPPVAGAMPPTIIFHGTSDRTVPFQNVTNLVDRCTASGASCQLVSFPGVGHGFFNVQPYRADTLRQTATFLQDVWAP